MSVVEIVDHPLIQHKISLLRDRNTGTKEFRDLVSEVAMLLCYEATRDLPTEEVEVETPIALARTKVLAGRKLALVPILRAGLGMVDGMLSMIPAAKVGHIGLYRNEGTLEPVEYYCKLPNDIAEREVMVLDPMLATGGSAIDAITTIKKKGAKHIKFIGLLAAPEGMKALHEAHPDVDIYVGALDERLNDKGYIVPGLAAPRRGRPHFRHQVTLFLYLPFAPAAGRRACGGGLCTCRSARMNAHDLPVRISLSRRGPGMELFCPQQRTCYDSYYPFQLFPARGLRALELADVTILYGGNGSGKTTAPQRDGRNAAPAAVHAVQHDELLSRLLPPVQRAHAARAAGAQLHFDQRRRV